MKDRFHFLTTDWSGFDGVAFQERAIAVKKSGTCHMVALQLIRRLDAVGAPYSICVARCQRAPGGLHLGLLQGGAQQYCVDTMRQTGDAEQSRAAAQKGSGKKGWGNNSGWSGNSGNSGWSGWGGSGSKGGSGGWGKPSGQGTGWGAPLTTTFQGPVRPGPGMATQAPPQAASQAAPQAAPQASTTTLHSSCSWFGLAASSVNAMCLVLHVSLLVRCGPTAALQLRLLRCRHAQPGGFCWEEAYNNN